MPNDLLETQANLARFKTEVAATFPPHVVTEEQEEIWLLLQARRALSKARAEVLALMPTKPQGVGELEFRAAKGVKFH
jgi:hypothetical protein